MVKEGFEYLTERYFKIERAQIIELPDQELEVLLAMTNERAEKIMAKRRILCFFIIGWVSIVFDCFGWYEKIFLKEIRDLKLILGDKYDPVKIVRTPHM